MKIILNEVVNMDMQTSKSSVFVTYSWDKSTNEKVFSFVNFLRKNGFEAFCDMNTMDKQSTSSFSQIMNDGLLSPKVIVVLTSSYKEKAEKNSGGVGVEYKIISSDISQNPNKYILVSFESLSGDTRCKIVPKLYESFSIIDLVADEKNDFEILFSKIMDKPTLGFSQVADKMPIIKPKEIVGFTLKNELRCPGYGSMKGICNNIIVDNKNSLCEDCSKEDFKDRITGFYENQGFLITPCPSDRSAFISVLHYGYTTSSFLIKTFSQLNGNISADEVLSLRDLALSETDRIGHPLHQIHLVSKSPVNLTIREISLKQGFIIKTEKELIKGIMDLTSYFKSFQELYEKSSIYKHYISLNDADGVSLIDIVKGFILDKESNALLFLGEYGCGKTSFCMNLTYKLIQSHIKNNNNYIPIYIRLRDFNKAISMDDLLTNFLINRCNVNNGNINNFKQLLQYGRVILIFDGFDEIAKRVDYDVKYQVFNEICKYAFGNTKIILTCRPNFFQDQHEYERLFKASYLHYEPDSSNDIEFDKVYIGDFSIVKIKKFIKSYENDLLVKGITISEFYDKLCETHDLMDLAKRPFLLSIIVETLPEIINQYKKNNKELNFKIDAATLYERYTLIWLDREEKKGKTLIKSFDKRLFCENLAFQMFASNEYSIHFSKLPHAIKQHFKSLSDMGEIDYFSHDIQSCSFLKTDGKGNFSFIHKSFIEFFVANVIVHKLYEINKSSKPSLNKIEQLNKTLGLNYISTEISLFIGDFLREDNNINNLVKELLKDNIYVLNEMATRNALSILSKAGFDIGNTIKQLGDLEQIDLSKIDLSYAQISNVVISNALFDHATFYNAKLVSVTFQNCSFDGASFESAKIRNVNFKKQTLESTIWNFAEVELCDFSYSNLVGCHLNESTMIKCNFMHSDLSDCTIDEDTLFGDCIGFESAIGAPYLNL